jgi:crossover junction endodeoxyribonuclease RusA
MIAFNLPWPPSVNHYWRSIPLRRCSRVILSREGRRYRERVCARLVNSGVPPLGGRLEVRLVLHAPSRRTSDIDNRIKAIGDALEHAGVIGNDSQIDHWDVWRGPVVKGGMAVVEIEEMRR